MVPRGGIEPSGFALAGYAGTSLRSAGSSGCGDTDIDGARGRDRTTDTAIFSRLTEILGVLRRWVAISSCSYEISGYGDLSVISGRV